MQFTPSKKYHSVLGQYISPRSKYLPWYTCVPWYVGVLHVTTAVKTMVLP